MFLSARGTQNRTGKSRFYAKSSYADVPINFRFNVDAHTSIFVKRFLHTLDPKLPVTECCNRPILLKKSAMVATSKKYALEIEIFTLSRGFRAQISRSCAQKRRFQQSVRGESGRTDFFNTIGQKRTPALHPYRHGTAIHQRVTHNQLGDHKSQRGSQECKACNKPWQACFHTVPQ